MTELGSNDAGSATPGGAGVPALVSANSLALAPFGEDDAGDADLSEREKAAIVLVALGPEASGALVEDLGEERLRRFIRTARRLSAVSPDKVDAVLGEFLARIAERSAVEGGPEETRRFLEGVLAAERASSLWAEVEAEEKSVWTRLAESPEDRLAKWLRGEHQQVAAIVLSRMTASKAASILEAFDQTAAKSIVRRMGRAHEVDPSVVDGIAAAIERDFLAEEAASRGKGDPAHMIANVMNHVSNDVRSEIIGYLATETPDLAETVKKVMFTFENIIERVNSRDVGLITKSVDEGTLLTALKLDIDESGGEVASYILDNISKRLAERIREDISLMEALDKKDGEAAQGVVVATIQELRDSGQIKLLV